jgi:hypothetical protein
MKVDNKPSTPYQFLNNTYDNLAHNILNRKIQETLVLIFFFAGSDSDVELMRKKDTD